MATRPALLAASLVTEGRKLSLLRNSVLLRVPNTSDNLYSLGWPNSRPALPGRDSEPLVEGWGVGEKSDAALPSASAQSARLVYLGCFPHDKIDHRMAERTLLSLGPIFHHTVQNRASFFHMTRFAPAQIGVIDHAFNFFFRTCSNPFRDSRTFQILSLVLRLLSTAPRRTSLDLTVASLVYSRVC